jgi:hypothetical protein
MTSLEILDEQIAATREDIAATRVPPGGDSPNVRDLTELRLQLGRLVKVRAEVEYQELVTGDLRKRLAASEG